MVSMNTAYAFGKPVPNIMQPKNHHGIFRNAGADKECYVLDVQGP